MKTLKIDRKFLRSLSLETPSTGETVATAQVAKKATRLVGAAGPQIGVYGVLRNRLVKLGERFGHKYDIIEATSERPHLYQVVQTGIEGSMHRRIGDAMLLTDMILWLDGFIAGADAEAGVENDEK